MSLTYNNSAGLSPSRAEHLLNDLHVDELVASKMLESGERTIEDSRKHKEDDLLLRLRGQRTPEIQPSSLASEPNIKDLKNDLALIRSKYHNLLCEKKLLEHRYESDYQKWRDFKQWVLQGGPGRGNRSNASASQQLPTPRSVHKRVSNHPSKPRYSADLPADPQSVQKYIPKVQSDMKENIDIASKQSPRKDELAVGNSPSSPLSSFAKRKRLTSTQNSSPSKRIKYDNDTLSAPGPSMVRRGQSSKVKAVGSAVKSLCEPTGRQSLPDTHDANTPTPALDRNAADVCTPRSSYAAFKGRGRYAKETEVAEHTINSSYRLNTSRNSGLNFQFDDAVRSKHDRKHLNAGDCECCRDYYEAVGPLPYRPEPPLWRSQPTTPMKGRARPPMSPIGHQSKHSSPKSRDEVRHRAIVEHRQEISRHRQQWEVPKTPPGYWDIGFPDTQEAVAINHRAQKMHKEKKVNVENEARAGGRYQKR